MSEASPVFDVNPQTFQAEVIERSRQVPVVLLFWAEQVAPSAQTREVLARLTAQFQGKVLLGLVDVARDPTLAQHLRVQGLPSIRVVSNGQLVEQIDGPQPEEVLRGMLEQLTQSPSDLLKAELDTLLENGDFARALDLLQQAVRQEPANQGFRVELADLLIRQGTLEDARTVLAGIPEDTPERDRPANRLAFAEEAAGMRDAAELGAALEADPDDLDAHYDLSVVLAVKGDFAGALDHAMHILKQDRTYREDLGRTTMIRIFAVLGKGSELATGYRRKMFNFMH